MKQPEREKTHEKSNEEKRKEQTPRQKKTQEKDNLNPRPKHFILLFVGHGFFQEKNGTSKRVRTFIFSSNYG